VSKLGALLRSRVLCVTAALCLSNNLLGPNALAAEPTQSPNVEQRRAEAQEHFENGLRLANVEHDWKGALDEFLLSRSLFPRRSATRNAAIALRELGRYAEALDLYQTLFAEFADQMPADEQASAHNEESRLRQRVGGLELRDAQPGTAVNIDGRFRGLAPLATPIWLDLGGHTLRLSREGQETAEHEIRIVAGATAVVSAKLKPLQDSGVLSVSEVHGEDLEVVVDSLSVGRTPWRGSVAVGRHSVLLRGQRRGTVPAAVRVNQQQVVELALEAVALDSGIAIEPTPESATIFVDGTFVGTGPWFGVLPSGRHRVEALAPGYLPFGRDIRLESGHRSAVPVTLQRSVEPSARPLTGLYLEPAVGVALARSFGGELDASCKCSDRSRPFGWLGSLRAGYVVSSSFAVEVTGGYLDVGESATRTLVLQGDSGAFTSHDYADSVRLIGPFASVGGSARLGRRFPLTARLSAGVTRLSLHAENGGTFAGSLGPGQSASHRLSVPEPVQNVWGGFASTELHIGYQISRHWSADVGVALSLFFMTSTRRPTRYLTFPDEPARTNAGVLTLDSATAVATFPALQPLAAARYEF